MVGLSELHAPHRARKTISDRPGNVNDVVLRVVAPLEGHHNELLFHVHPNIREGVAGTGRGEIGVEDGELGELTRAVVYDVGGDAGRLPISERGEEGGLPGKGVRVRLEGIGEGEGEEGKEEGEEEEVAVPATCR